MPAVTVVLCLGLTTAGLVVSHDPPETWCEIENHYEIIEKL